MRRPRRFGVIIAVVIAMLAGTGGWLLWPRSAEPITESDALTRFRRDSARSTVAPEQVANNLPEVGVYRYAASGGESVKLGVLPAETRTLPATVTAVVQRSADGKGCFVLTLNLVGQHTEDTTYCRSADGSIELRSLIKHQRIGALSPVATLRCDPSTLAGRSIGSNELRCDFTASLAAAKLQAEVAGHAVVAPTASVTVGVVSRSVRPVTVDYRFSDDLDGTSHERLWFDETTAMPTRIERTLELVGPARFREQWELMLEDATPRR